MAALAVVVIAYFVLALFYALALTQLKSLKRLVVMTVCLAALGSSFFFLRVGIIQWRASHRKTGQVRDANQEEGDKYE